MYNKTEFSVVTSALFWTGPKHFSHVGKAALSHKQINSFVDKNNTQTQKASQALIFLKNSQYKT